MKSIDGIYKYGNLYNRETGKRILIEDTTEISIVLNESRLLAEDPNNKPHDNLNEEEKKQAVFKNLGPIVSNWRLFESGKILYFDISAGVRKTERNDFIYRKFQVRLTEDLYIYNKRDGVEYARFFDCNCVVEASFPKLDYFEPVYAKSLNDAYTKTYELYFAMYGKSTCNAFDRFFEALEFKSPIRNLTESIQGEPSI